MFQDDRDTEGAQGGRRALIAAYLAVVMLLGAAFGYVFFVPAEEGELERYGEVTQPLNPAPAPTPSESAATDAQTASDTGQQTAASTSGMAGTAADSATAAGTATAVGGNESESQSATAIPEAPDPESGESQSQPPTTQQNETGQSARTTESDTAGGQSSSDVPESRLTGEAQSEPAWQKYARVLSPPKGVSRIAVIVRGLGLSSAATEAAIKRLPGEVSLSFSPYARRSVEWTLRARARGHEVLMDLPMEPRAFPASDPGPRALMTSTPTPQNLERLQWVLGKGREIIGVVGQMGSAFVKNKRAVAPVLRTLKKNGLVYIDNGDVPENAALKAAAELKLPHTANDRTLDQGQVSRAAIRSRLVEAERLAQQQGVAVVLAHPYPVTIDLLQNWSREIDERGIALVPVTNALQIPGRTEAAQLR